MTTIDELTKQVSDQADLLDELAGRLSAFTQQQERERLEAILSDGIPLRLGAPPEGADVADAGTTEPGQTNYIAAGAITAETIAADAVTAEKIAAGSVTAEHLLVGSGRTFLTNPGFETGTLTGWTFAQSGTGGSAAIGSDASWRSEGAYYGVITAGTGDNDIYQIIPTGFRYGDKIMVSALLANATGTKVIIGVEWQDSTGTAISSYASAAFAVAGGYGAAGPTRYNVVTTAAPAGTVGARIIIRLQTGGGALLVDDIQVSRSADGISPDGNVVINSSGITITGGKISVTNASATVIIDGSSNMFKIAASGTTSATAGATATTTLTGLGTQTTILAFLGFVSPFNSTTGRRHQGRSDFGHATVGPTLYAAATSGGAVTTAFYNYAGAHFAGALDGSSQMFLDFVNTDGATNYGYYYVLKEAAL